jgi:hypothetical protein
MNWEGCGRKRSWTNSRYYPGICLEGLRKTMKNLSQDSRSPGRDLNPGPLEYEAGVVTTRPRRSVYTAVYYQATHQVAYVGSRSVTTRIMYRRHVSSLNTRLAMRIRKPETNKKSTLLITITAGSLTWNTILFADYCLLGCCAEQSSRSLPAFQRFLLPSSSGRSETSMKFYQITRRDIPKDSHLHIRCCENLKSHNILCRPPSFIDTNRWHSTNIYLTVKSRNKYIKETHLTKMKVTSLKEKYPTSQ